MTMNEKPGDRINGFKMTQFSPSVPSADDVRREMDALHERLLAAEAEIKGLTECIVHINTAHAAHTVWLQGISDVVKPPVNGEPKPEEPKAWCEHIKWNENGNNWCWLQKDHWGVDRFGMSVSPDVFYCYKYGCGKERPL